LISLIRIVEDTYLQRLKFHVVFLAN